MVVALVAAVAPSAFLLGLARVFFPRRHSLRTFIRKQVFSALLGVAFSAAFFSVVGKSQDETIIGFIRSTILTAMEIAGLDPVTRCVYALEREYRFTPASFAQEASDIGKLLLDNLTLGERELILALAGERLLFGGVESREQLLNETLVEYCTRHPDRLAR